MILDKIQVGDIVGCKFHSEDIFFKVAEIETEDSVTVVLKGINCRLLVKCNLGDLIEISRDTLKNYWDKFFLMEQDKIQQIIQHQQAVHCQRKQEALKGLDGVSQE